MAFCDNHYPPGNILNEISYFYALILKKLDGQTAGYSDVDEGEKA